MSDKTTFPESLWAGSEHSLDIAMEAHARLMAGIFSSAQSTKQDEDEVPWTFSMDGSIGVISIKGPLVNSDDRYNKYMGVTGYPDIRKALLYAVNKPEVKAILLDVNSGGGAVNGVADTGDLIKLVDKQVKPVYAYTEGTMGSAAYWLGASARKVYSSSTSTLGSIGVILTHKEYSKMFKEEGIGVTVMRAGKFKALVNPYEPLTETAIDQMQAQLDAAYTIFAEHISKARGVSLQVFESTMGQGREFFGIDAVKVGLSDGITNYDGVISKISAKLLDKSDVTQNNLGKYQGNDMGKKALTEQEIAAIAAGASLEAGVPKDEGDDKLESKGESKTPESEVKAEKEDSAVLAYVQGQLISAQAEASDLKVKLAMTESLVASMKATHESLIAIAAKSASTMRVALSLPAVDLATQGAEAVLADHKAVSEAFTKHFKAAGVAAVNVAASKGLSPDNDEKRMRRIAATSSKT